MTIFDPLEGAAGPESPPEQAERPKRTKGIPKVLSDTLTVGLLGGEFGPARTPVGSDAGRLL